MGVRHDIRRERRSRPTVSRVSANLAAALGLTAAGTRPASSLLTVASNGPAGTGLRRLHGFAQ